MKRAETSTGESTRPVSCESHGRILAVRSTSGFESHDFAECTSSRRHQRALLARIHADRLPVFQEQERGQRAPRLPRARPPPVAASRKCGAAENRDLRPRVRRCRPGRSWWCRGRCRSSSRCTFSRTLNSSFQRRPSRATHHSCSMPVSVTTVSNDTGTTSDGILARPKLTSIGESSSRSSPKSSIRSPGLIVLARRRREEAELRRLAHHQSELAIRECAASVPSSMPNGTTVSALSGAGKPGTEGIALSMPT